MRISIIGSGNTAFALAGSLHKAGFRLEEIIGRNRTATRKLAALADARPVYNISHASDAASLFFICVRDEAIGSIADSLDVSPQYIVHTSGATDIQSLSRFKSPGIFYPVNTLTSSSPLIPAGTSIAVESPDRKLLATLKKIAKGIQCIPYDMNSASRLIVHLSAVFANNFTNSLYQVSYDLLKSNDLDPRILFPLIRSTAANAVVAEPATVQTGPAVRNDIITMKKHLGLIGDAQVRKAYKLLSSLILQQQADR
jgi:predicted short-subunit dehydrogenase-like oxidoreductase (DUF2520 family)